MVLNPSVWALCHLWATLRAIPYTATVRRMQEPGEVAAEGPAEEGAEGSGAGYVCLQAPQLIERTVRACTEHPKAGARHERTL
jgi:hypothetical protein